MNPGSATMRSLARAVAGLCAFLVAGAAFASAGGPFGNAPPEEGYGFLLFFPRLLGPFVSAQIAFQRHLTAATHAVANDPGALAGLLALSFAYGALHAAGPGHGKAVVSSYVMATRQTLRNGVLLAFLSSTAQALCAIAVAVVAARLFHLTSVKIANATLKLEIVADAAILLLGVRLVWSKILRPLKRRLAAPAGLPAFVSLQAAPGGELSIPVTSRFAATEVADCDAEDCDCGALHMPDATFAAGGIDWRKAWMVITTTGLRPCSGALIVLAFAISQHVLAAGVAATIAMGLGTFVTVAAFAVLSASSRAGLLWGSAAGASPRGALVMRWFEAGGALIVLVFGLLLLAGHILLDAGWAP
jgi:ABC-type nickel/cobalt efflux system permease component RcnA